MIQRGCCRARTVHTARMSGPPGSKESFMPPGAAGADVLQPLPRGPPVHPGVPRSRVLVCRVARTS